MLSYEFVTLFIKMAFPSVINRKVIGTGDYLMKIITMGGGGNVVRLCVVPDIRNLGLLPS